MTLATSNQQKEGPTPRNTGDRASNPQKLPASWAVRCADGLGLMKMLDDLAVVLDAVLRLVPVSPRLVWRGGLPGAPDCCHEHACQTR